MADAAAATTGVLGDIHLDLAGLDGALDGPLAGCDAFVVTGDVLDRGPDDPADVLERVLALPKVVLLAGNHELAYLGGPVYRGMREDRCRPLAPLLRDLVIDGRMRAAASVGNVLCVHGGVSLAWWRRHMANAVVAGADTAAGMANHLDRTLLRAVGRRSFTDPAFNALESDEPGPFWASIREDLLEGGTPPFDQVVGHVPYRPGWHHAVGGGGKVYPVCREAEGHGAVGWAVLEGLPSAR